MEYELKCFFNTKYRIPQSISFDDSVGVRFIPKGEYSDFLCLSVTGSQIYELILVAKTDEQAEQIADLLCSSFTVVNGYNVYKTWQLVDEARQEKQKGDYFKAGRSYFCDGGESWYYASVLASKAVHDQKKMNAICKYHTAHEIVDLHYMDLNPYTKLQYEYLLSDQIRYSNVIVTCYSILEELGLQAPKLERGSTLLESSGKWNSKIYKKLIESLNNRSIDPDKRIRWLSRAEINSSVYDSAIDKGELCSWSDGQCIKDYEIRLVDGILWLKGLRDKIGAHDMDKRVLRLSIYDAQNAFELTREMIMQSMGITSENYKLEENNTNNEAD